MNLQTSMNYQDYIVFLFIKSALKEQGISSEGIGKEAAWVISWTEIKEQK